MNVTELININAALLNTNADLTKKLKTSESTAVFYTEQYNRNYEFTINLQKELVDKVAEIAALKALASRNPYHIENHIDIRLADTPEQQQKIKAYVELIKKAINQTTSYTQ